MSLQGFKDFLFGWQAIDVAIEWKLKKVEAGAQGEHKIQRGYMPTTTYSAHYFTDTMFEEAVRSFFIVWASIMEIPKVESMMILQTLQ